MTRIKKSYIPANYWKKGFIHYTISSIIITIIIIIIIIIIINKIISIMTDSIYCVSFLPICETMTTNNMKNSLLILFGESFRLGGQGNRNTGSKDSYEAQINAAKTHVDFIMNLKKKNINMLVSINSYTTQYDEDLNKIYKDVLYDKIYYNNLLGQNKLIHNCLDRIDNINKFDFILCMRIDLFLKDKFTEIFNENSDKILFPSICFEPHHKIGSHPRVNDVMMFVPRKYIDFFKENKYDLNHNTWYELVEKYNFNYDELDMMLNTYHDSDSAKDYNPIYYIINRPENKIHTTTKIFNKYNF